MSQDLTTRERRQVVPSMKDESSWFRFCLGGSLAEADGSLEKEATNKAKVIEAVEGIVIYPDLIYLLLMLTPSETHSLVCR
jgi:hypothetical protein